MPPIPFLPVSCCSSFFKLRPGSTAVSCYCLLLAKDRSVPAHLAFLLYHIVPIFSRGHVHGVLLCVVGVQYILNSWSCAQQLGKRVLSFMGKGITQDMVWAEPSGNTSKIRSYIYFWKALRRGTLESFVCWFGRRKAGQNHCSDGFHPLSYCTFLFCPKHCIL